MPELPEVEALALDLGGRLDGRAIVTVHVPQFSALKTYRPPISALEGTLVDRVGRFGKFLDIEASGTHLVLHLARAGWVRWRDEVPAIPPKPSPKSTLALRIVLDDDGSGTSPGLDVTEAGTRKSLAAYVVRDPMDVPGIASLGPDPLTDDFTEEALGEILQREGRKQLKGVLRHQGTIAGIGNAYSDEILHAARMSPFKHAGARGADDVVRRAPLDPRRGRRPVPRARGQRAQGREEVEPRRPRPHRPGLPGLRRHRARGVLRRLEPAVLPDLPDRRQAARRPADVAAAEVGVGRAAGRFD